MRWLTGGIRWGTAWTATLRGGGLFIVIHEALSSSPTERPVLYIVACAMMGVTLTIPADKRRRDQ